MAGSDYLQPWSISHETVLALIQYSYTEWFFFFVKTNERGFSSYTGAISRNVSYSLWNSTHKLSCLVKQNVIAIRARASPIGVTLQPATRPHKLHVKTLGDNKTGKTFKQKQHLGIVPTFFTRRPTAYAPLVLLAVFPNLALQMLINFVHVQYTVSQKTVKNCFCQNFVKFPPILITFGKKRWQRG